MKLLTTAKNYLDWPYSHILNCFVAGVGLEVFMNLFHIGEANIYRSIKKNLSTSRAEEQFEFEKQLYEKVQDEFAALGKRGKLRRANRFFA